MKKVSQFPICLFACIITAVVPSSSLALRLRSPPLGTPIVYNNYVVFSSRDSKTLICINLQGRKIWERKYSSHIYYSRRDDSSVAVQAGTDIGVVDVPTGKETPLFKVRSEHELVHSSSHGTLVYSEHDYTKERHFRMLDPKSGSVLWENTDIEDVSLVLEDMLICLTGIRDYQSKITYSLTDAAVAAFDRKSGKRVWKTPLPEGLYYSWLLAVYVRPHIVIEAAPGLICLRAGDGKIVSTIDEKLISDIGTKDGLLVYMRTLWEHKKPRPKPQTFVHSCSVPDFKEESVTALSTTDSMLFFTCYDKYMITETGSMAPKTLCFDAKSGKRIWKKDHLGRSEPVNGKIYFSDLWDNKEYTALTARIGVIDIASGNETILYEEKISDDDSGS